MQNIPRHAAIFLSASVLGALSSRSPGETWSTKYLRPLHHIAPDQHPLDGNIHSLKMWGTCSIVNTTWILLRIMNHESSAAGKLPREIYTGVIHPPIFLIKHQQIHGLSQWSRNSNSLHRLHKVFPYHFKHAPQHLYVIQVLTVVLPLVAYGTTCD